MRYRDSSLLRGNVGHPSVQLALQLPRGRRQTHECGSTPLESAGNSRYPEAPLPPSVRVRNAHPLEAPGGPTPRCLELAPPRALLCAGLAEPDTQTPTVASLGAPSLAPRPVQQQALLRPGEPRPSSPRLHTPPLPHRQRQGAPEPSPPVDAGHPGLPGRLPLPGQQLQGHRPCACQSNRDGRAAASEGRGPTSACSPSHRQP